METPGEVVNFLTRSNHRVAVLRRLSNGPCDRRTLHETIGSSQPTLGRVLGAFQDRGWVTRDGHTYRLTSLGEAVVEELDRLCLTVEAAARLAELAPWLPSLRGLDVRHLADAEVVVANPSDSIAPIRHAAAGMREADRVRILSSAITPNVVEATWQASHERGQTFEGVVTPGVIETIRGDPQMRRWMQETFETGGTSLYRVDEPVQQVLGVMDDVAGFIVVDDQGNQRALVTSTNQPVAEWVDARIDEYRERADEVAATEFVPDGFTA